MFARLSDTIINTRIVRKTNPDSSQDG